MGFVFLIHSAILCLLIEEFILFTFKAIIDRYVMGLPWWLSSNKSACSAGATGDTGSIPGSERSPGGRHGNPRQYSCLENPMHGRAWEATVHALVKSWTPEGTEHACTNVGLEGLLGGLDSMVSVKCQHSLVALTGRSTNVRPCLFLSHPVRSQ